MGCVKSTKTDVNGGQANQQQTGLPRKPKEQQNGQGNNNSNPQPSSTIF